MVQVQYFRTGETLLKEGVTELCNVEQLRYKYAQRGMFFVEWNRCRGMLKEELVDVRRCLQVKGAYIEECLCLERS
jgi:hypothetical protein